MDLLPIKDLKDFSCQPAHKDWKDRPDARPEYLKINTIPSSELYKLRALLIKQNSLFPPAKSQSQMAQEASGNSLFERLGYVFHNYSMDPQSLLAIKEIISVLRPRVVLELGSGISTVVCADHMRQLYERDSQGFCYVTVDQSAEYISETRALVDRAGLSDFVKCLHSPVVPYIFGASGFSCYQFNEEMLFDAFNGLRPEMVIIDGPVGGGANGVPFARLLTAPAVRRFCVPKACVLMDDALRDTEIEIIRHWEMSKALHIQGVKAVGRGLMIGYIP
ncbi:MAG: class I SAM-dependent methyltransferase [Alphaproteobacteria bacterium]|nr:class I SAM-dependent methyltransferase [Alphaproteobacteria bacterium]